MAECYTYIKIQHETIIFQGVSFLYAYKMVKKKTYCDIHARIVLAGIRPILTKDHFSQVHCDVSLSTHIIILKWHNNALARTGRMPVYVYPYPIQLSKCLLNTCDLIFFFKYLKFQENTWKQNCIYSKIWKHDPVIVYKFLK